MIDPSAITQVLQLILPAIQSRPAESAKKPLIVGLSGLQGSGKSTWAAAITTALNEGHGICARTLSFDDLYLDHPQLVALREANPENCLLRTRGQPGTHDEVLAQRLFEGLRQRQSSPGLHNIRWPAFDKSLHGGEGGRVPESEWDMDHGDQPLEVLIFEGWCLGFQALPPAIIEEKWKAAKRPAACIGSKGPSIAMSTQTLAAHQLDHLLLLNQNLKKYCQSFMGPEFFDAFIHLDTKNLLNVYSWRLDQEAALRKAKGSGMTDEEVITFVRGYMPAYELYLGRLSAGRFFPESGEQVSDKIHIRIILDEQRQVCSLDRIM